MAPFDQEFYLIVETNPGPGWPFGATVSHQDLGIPIQKIQENNFGKQEWTGYLRIHNPL